MGTGSAVRCGIGSLLVHRRARVLTASLGFLALAVAGCSTSHPGPVATTTVAAKATTTTTVITTTSAKPSTNTAKGALPVNPVDRAVLESWKAAEDAFYTASYTSDAAAPALAATMVNPALQQARALLYAEKHDGYVGRGSYDLGHPKVTSVKGNKAVVVSCIYDGVIEVNASTGKPAPAPLGVAQKAEETAMLVRVGPSKWKELRLSVREGSCVGR